MTREEYWKSLPDDYKQALKHELDYPSATKPPATKREFNAFCKKWNRKPAQVFNDLVECECQATVR